MTKQRVHQKKSSQSGLQLIVSSESHLFSLLFPHFHPFSLILLSSVHSPSAKLVLLSGKLPHYRYWHVDCLLKVCE